MSTDVIAADRSSNEQAVRLSKKSTYISRELDNHQSIKTWLC